MATKFLHKLYWTPVRELREEDVTLYFCCRPFYLKLAAAGKIDEPQSFYSLDQLMLEVYGKQSYLD